MKTGNTMKSVYTGMMAAVMIAAATLTFTACSSEAEELLLPEVPEQTATDHSYTLTVNASKGEEGTRALTLSNDENDIIATWAVGDVVTVYKGNEEVGELKAQNDGANTTLTGELTSALELNDELTLKYLSPDYSNQEGTLASIAEKCDYAVATVTVNSVTEEGKISTTDAAFKNQQAIVKFTLKDKNGTEINPTSFSVKYGNESIEINNISEDTYTTNDAGVLYVAIPGGEEQDVVLKANVESTVYTFMRHGVKFDNANYYPINVRMENNNEEYLTFEAKEAGAKVTVKMNGSKSKLIYYRKEGDSKWESKNIYKENPLSIDLANKGDKVMFKSEELSLGQIGNFLYFYVNSGECYVYGNIMSLHYGDDFATKTSFKEGSTCTFINLFKITENVNKIFNHPSKTLVLPAKELVESCYSNMFEGCSNLTSAPELPATTMAEACYYSMFKGCTGLTTAPKLPATTLAKGCYNDMFRDCSNLSTAPKLPATTLAEGCYKGMFQGCTSLTTAPDLLAETGATSCYQSMFYGCSNLNSVRCYINPKNSITFTSTWLSYVASSGTVYTKSGTSWKSITPSGIPDGWTRVDE